MTRTRVLFRVHNRRGLGHLIRSQNLARALHAERPAVHCLMATSVPPQVEEPKTAWNVVGDPAAWRHVVDAFRPDLVVFDTLPPDIGEDHLPKGARRAFVLRRGKDDLLLRVEKNAFVRCADVILVPHTEEEFSDFPDGLRARAKFVGPIGRSPTAAGRLEAARSLGLEEDAFLLLTTPGGGGFEGETREFFRSAVELGRRLARERPNLVHVLVLGPNFAGELSLPDVQILPATPRLPDLLGRADAAVIQAGYNTVMEVRLAATPCVVIPGARRYDDQESRADELVAWGGARRWDGRHETSLATLVEWLASDKDLVAARRSLVNTMPQLGNVAAAKILLELLS